MEKLLLQENMGRGSQSAPVKMHPMNGKALGVLPKLVSQSWCCLRGHPLGVLPKLVAPKLVPQKWRVVKASILYGA